MNKEELQATFRLSRILPRARLAAERDAQSVKWFDYRFLSAHAATQLFADEYERIYRRKWAEAQDRVEAEKKRPVRDIQKNKVELAGVWGARLMADHMGIPYFFYIAAAIDAALGRGYKHLPRPNQLSSGQSPAIISIKWEKWLEASLTYSKLPVYRAANFIGLPEQVDHQEWIIDQLRKVGASDFRIGQLVYVEELLQELRAIKEFGAERVERAKCANGQSSVTVAPFSNEDRFRSCYGLPACPDSAVVKCQNCDLTKNCTNVSRRIEALLVEKLGSNDPHRANVLAKGRERQRRWRAKKKLAGMTP